MRVVSLPCLRLRYMVESISNSISNIPVTVSKVVTNEVSRLKKEMVSPIGFVTTPEIFTALEFNLSTSVPKKYRHPKKAAIKTSVIRDLAFMR